MNFKSNSSGLIPLAFAAVAALGFAMTGAAQAAPISSGATAGGACTVTEGANKGKTGTYTTEEGTGKTWCEGSWGGTECTGGRCKDGASRLISTMPVLQPKTLVFTR